MKNPDIFLHIYADIAVIINNWNVTGWLLQIEWLQSEMETYFCEANQEKAYTSRFITENVLSFSSYFPRGNALGNQEYPVIFFY
jgi:hypothetical protein